MNKLNSPAICCVNCGKGYKSRSGLDKHLVLCEIIHKIKSGKKVGFPDDDETEIPSPKIMYQMILQLAEKYHKLEEKTTEMNKWVVKKKKKMDVVAWLNESVKPDYEFVGVADHLIIDDADVEFMLDNSLHETIYRVLFRVLVEGDVVVPVFAFNQKHGILYMYEKEQWTELPADRLTRLLNICQRKISKGMLDWKKKHKDEINASDAFATRYDKAVFRLMSVEFHAEGHLNKVKNAIYARLKTDAKTVIEYEFE